MHTYIVACFLAYLLKSYSYQIQSTFLPSVPFCSFIIIMIIIIYRTATTHQIKSSYRKLALALHPDHHNGCRDKTKAFLEASEAYSILVDNERRRQYDMATGWGSSTSTSSAPPGWYNKNRRRAPPSNYRKVYAPHAPPDGKWHDAQRHYDMHYGDGMYREEMKRAFGGAKARGEFEYHSPLGKGFSFEDTAAGFRTGNNNSDKKNGNTSDNNNKNNSNDSFNPFSKADQGPPPKSQFFHYEESYMISESKTVLKTKTNVVDRLHQRRAARMEAQQQKQPAAAATAAHGQQGAGPRHYTPYNLASAACTIM
jgi:curved DNA-binding protein CbpA